MYEGLDTGMGARCFLRAQTLEAAIQTFLENAAKVGCPPILWKN